MAPHQELNPDQQRWFRAAEEGRVAELEGLPRSALRLRDPVGTQTLLHRAAEHGRAEVVALLLRRGANVEEKVKGGKERALHLAARAGALSTVNVLVRHGAEPDATNSPSVRMTALHFAAGAGSAPVIEVLCQAGADVNARSKSGGTALLFASANNHLDAVRVLLRLGAQSLNRRGRTSLLHNAASLGNQAMVELALAHPHHLDAPDAGGDTPLMLAAKNGHGEVVTRLLDLGANPLAGKHLSALAAAALHGQLEICDLLASHSHSVAQGGHDPNRGVGPTPWGSFAAVCLYAPLKIVRWWLDHDADPNAGPETVDSPLMGAAAGGRFDVIEWLINAGANVDFERRGMGNALHALVRAAAASHEDRPWASCIKRLISAGVSTSSVDRNGLTPADLARSLDLEDIARMISG